MTAPATFATLRQQGQARPPHPDYGMQSTTLPDDPYRPRTYGPTVPGGFGPQNPEAPPPGSDPGTGGTGSNPGYHPPNPPPPQDPPPPNQPPGGGGTFNPQNPYPDIGQQLYGQWQGYRGTQPFSGQAQQQSLPGAFQPQQFQGSYQAQKGPQAFGYQPFNAQAQNVQGPQSYQGISGPTPQQVGGFNPSANVNADQLNQTVGSGLSNPSAYGSQQVQDTYNMLNRQLGQGFDVQRQQINEDAARRGLYYSTPTQGRLGDVATNQANAQQNLATSLLDRQAQTYGQDRAAAIAQALGVQQAGFGNQLAGYQANNAGNAQNFQQQLASAAFAGDQQAQQVLSSLNNAQFGQGQNQQQFQNALAGFGANQGAQQQNFGQRMAGSQFNADQLAQALGLNLGVNQANNAAGQQGFQNQFNLANQQQANNQQGFQNQLAGFGANQGANQQNFSQQQALLNSLLGFGQQQFSNQLDTAKFNQNQDTSQLAFLLQALGLGGGGGSTG